MDDSRLRKLECDFPYLIEEPTDLYYLTGLTLSKGRLLVTEKQNTLFVDGRYFEKAKKEAPCEVAPWEESKKIHYKQIGFDSAFISYEEYLEMKRQMPSIDWIPKPHPIQHLRVIKEEKEIGALKKAAHLTQEGYKHIVSLLKEGVSEEELSLEFEIFCRKNGASRLSFSPIIAFGENSAYPHHRSGKCRLKKGDVVLIDVGAVVGQYCGDMTRIVYFKDPDERVLQLEHLVQSAKEKAIAAIQPGVPIGKLDEIVQNAFDQANVKEFYTHSLGHGIGLEVHEFPRIRFDGADKDLILKKGMVFTIEPGLYQPGVGGIRLEDMVLVTESGFEIFLK